MDPMAFGAGGFSVMEPVDWSVFRDEGVLVAAVLLLLGVDLVRPRRLASPAPWILLAGALASLAGNLLHPVADAGLWGDSYVVDPLSRLFKSVFLGALVLVTLASARFMKDSPARGEFYFLLGASTLGMMLLVGAGNLVSLFVALELASISLYLAAGIDRGEARSQEAGLKYLLVGAFSSALFLFGTSLIYAVCGSLKLADISMTVGTHIGEPLALCGLVMMLVGMGFKIAAVPFHMWAPDVYEGGPTPMVAFASVASKAAGFAVMLRILLWALRDMQGEWVLLLSVMAVLTMAIGSFVAIPQTNVKRLLAYSSIAQAGFILVGFVAGSERGVSSVLFYLVVYLFTNLGAFLSVMVCSRHSGSDEIAGLAGLARRSPLLALVFMLSLLSLAGIPPLGGFVGKLYLFAAAMEHGTKFLWLVVVAILLTIVCLYYYLMVIRRMYIEEPGSAGPVSVGPAATIALVCCLGGTMILGIWPGPLIRATTAVAQVFLNP